MHYHAYHYATPETILPAVSGLRHVCGESHAFELVQPELSRIVAILRFAVHALSMRSI